MLHRLADLREQHGDHPVLLETIAEYTDDEEQRAVLYREAAAIAVVNGLPTLSIRMSLAYALMLLGNPVGAVEELRLCGSEAIAADDEERAGWLSWLRTVAEYAEGDRERSLVYCQAIEVAAEHGQPSLSIRLGLVRHLLDTNQPKEASDELRACQPDQADAEEDDRTWWEAMVAEAGRAMQDGNAQ